MSKYKKYFTLSFDDGLEQDKVTIDQMRKYGIRGTFNINSGLLGEKANIKYINKYGLQTCDKSVTKSRFWKIADSDRIPEDEIRQVYAGMELASHGVNHLDQTKLSASQLRNEILQDREILQKYTDTPITGHAFPFGRTNAETEKLLKDNGFLYARGIQSIKAKENFRFPDNPLNLKPTCWHIESDFEKLVDQFIAAEATDSDLLFYVWGHGYEFDFAACKGLRETYERIFDKISRLDEIVKCTNGEAFRTKLLADAAAEASGGSPQGTRLRRRRRG